MEYKLGCIEKHTRFRTEASQDKPRSEHSVPSWTNGNLLMAERLLWNLGSFSGHADEVARLERNPRKKAVVALPGGNHRIQHSRRIAGSSHGTRYSQVVQRRKGFRFHHP